MFNKKQVDQLTNDPDELLTIEEAVDLLKISKPTLWRWCKTGKLNKLAIGGRRYFRKTELLNSLKSMKYEA